MTNMRRIRMYAAKNFPFLKNGKPVYVDADGVDGTDDEGKRDGIVSRTEVSGSFYIEDGVDLSGAPGTLLILNDVIHCGRRQGDRRPVGNVQRIPMQKSYTGAEVRLATTPRNTMQFIQH